MVAVLGGADGNSTKRLVYDLGEGREREREGDRAKVLIFGAEFRLKLQDLDTASDSQ